jgi:hypothetical protein
MNLLSEIGRKRTILISISILLVSIHTIYFYHSVKPEIETKKLIQQIIRFFLTVGLLYLVYIGKNWARILSIILFSIGTVGAIISLFAIELSLVNKLLFIVMVFVYSIAIYHFYISKEFKAFFEYQNNKNE